MQLPMIRIPGSLQKPIERVRMSARRYWLIHLAVFLLLLIAIISLRPALTWANAGQSAAACGTMQPATQASPSTTPGLPITPTSTTPQTIPAGSSQLPIIMTLVRQTQPTTTSAANQQPMLPLPGQPTPTMTQQATATTTQQTTNQQATGPATESQDQPAATATTTQTQPTPTATTTQPAASSGAINTMIVDMLHNIQQNGFDKNASINNGLGGLWINWRYGTNPLQVNLNGSGNPDGPGVKLRHDELTDLRYVHALWMYKNQNPGDTQFDSELTKYTAIVKREFAGTHNERGWVYDELIDIYNLSQDSFYSQTACSLAQYYFTTFYDAKAGLIYKASSANNANGTGSGAAGSQQPQRVDLALEIGCALVHAGVLFNQPDWKAAGEKSIQQLYATAYIAQYHEFVYLTTNILLPDGTANPNPSIYNGMSASLGYNLVGGQVRMGAVAQEILSLLHVYSITHDATYLNLSTDLLDPLTIDHNTLGLWDTQQQGYFNAAVFPGADVQHAGTPKISGNTKESGRQLQMLEAFRVANVYSNNRYQSMQDALQQVAIQHAYYPQGHGVVYEVTNDWKILVRNGKPFDWVTTEAMGIAFEGLFSLSRANPW